MSEYAKKPESAMLVHEMAGRITDAGTLDSTLAALISSVRSGKVNGGEFCAEVSRLNPFDRARVVQAFLHEYKIANNFTATTIASEGGNE